MKYIFTLIAFLTLYQSSLAQQPCGTYEYETYLGSKFPGFTEALNQTRQESLSGINRLNKVGNDTVYRIPVVFHIVWNKVEQNIHDSLIYSQLKVLNEAYRHRHKDTGKLRGVFKPVAGDTKIEFYLATTDPNGNATNGIDRVKTLKADFGDNSLFAETVKTTAGGGVDAWNTDKYLNIWVCKFTFNGMLFVAAYAFPPTNAKFWASNNFAEDKLQGVVTNYQYVGVGNPNDLSAGSMKEKTLIHEVGHFLGLRHIWADKRNTCFGEDDGLKDTPLCNSATTNCNTNKNTCNEGSGDKPDMIENYMDYSPYPCTAMFSKQQTDLMRFNLLNLRSSLYQLKVTIPKPDNFEKITVFPNPVMENLTINFELTGNYKMILTDIIGQSVMTEEFEIKDDFQHRVNIQNISQGIYHLSLLLNNGKVYRQKLVVN